MIELPAPSLPPAEAARRIAGGERPFWLTSPGPLDDVATAFDCVACDPVHVAGADDLEDSWARERRAWDAPAEAAGVPVGVGWLSYDLGRAWMRLPRRARDDHGWPDLEIAFYDAVWKQDARTGHARILARDGAAARRLSERLDSPAPPLARPRIGPLRPETSAAEHSGAVLRILEYLRAGDAYQVNLARRLSAEISAGDPVWLAAALRARAPAPHAIWIGAGPGAFLYGNSPERFLGVQASGRVETRPIKGTRARGRDVAEDARAGSELQASAKDRAEHVMIVDLERNDLGRVCRPSSIRVEGLARLMALPTVLHMVTTVSGLLRPGVGLMELLRATFPGGSVTGAPKLRAMQIIEELEPVRRGPYTGATGWLGAAGDLDLAVAIRTACVRAGRLSVSVGGGIVADSHPEAELAETEIKARAFAELCGDAPGRP